MVEILYDQIASEYNILQKQIKQLKSQIAKLPDASFFCIKDDKRVKWFMTDKNGTHYIPKSNRKLAEELAYKRYLSSKLKEFQSEQNALQTYLKKHSLSYGSADQMLSPENIYSELLSSHFAPRFSNTENSSRWESIPYETNPSHPENLIHPINLGFSVRSKSEAMIAMALHFNCVPFRYECALHLNDIVIYPDFTILHPITGKILYWEHFGMIDKASYQTTYLSKLKHYLANGIYPSIDLITTYESSEIPFSLEKINQVLNIYNLEKQ